MLIAVLLSRKTNGAHRWIKLNVFPFSPSSSKLALTIFLAYFFGETGWRRGDFWALLYRVG